MKLSCVQSNELNQRNNNNINNKKNNNSPNFTGFASGCAAFWQFVDAGGPALQFTVEDCSETNIPRSFKGAMAGRKYTGRINWPAFLQEAIREFLTGPLMCATPIAILALATKLSGKTADTHIENIENLSYLAKKSGSDVVDFKNNFFKTTVEDMLNKTVGIAKQEDVDTLVKGLKEYNAATDKKQAAQILDTLEKSFEAIIKREKADYTGVDFKKVFYSVADKAQGQTNFKNYTGYISAYADDFTKKLNKDGFEQVTQDAINSFKRTWIGKRHFIFASMFAVTAIVVSFVPKLYTMASGKINPNASAIYNEAKIENDTKTEEKEVK